MNPSNRARFYAKINQGDGCWEWTGAKQMRETTKSQLLDAHKRRTETAA